VFKVPLGGLLDTVSMACKGRRQPVTITRQSDQGEFAMLIKKSPKYQAAMKAAKSIKKARSPLETKLAIKRWCAAAIKMLG